MGLPTGQTERLVSNTYRRDDRLVILEKQGLNKASLENHIQKVDLAIRLMVTWIIRTGF